MLSKKHNDPFYWKNKLEALHDLPGGFTTTKDAMWEKLHGRLQQKPAHSKTAWYWIAAAIMPFIIIALTMMNRPANMLVNGVPAKEKNIKTEPGFLMPASKESLTVFTAVAVEKKKPVVVGLKSKNKATGDTENIDPVVAVTTLPGNQETSMAMKDIMPVDTNLNMAATAGVKKKLQVIHINELETVPAQFTAPVNYAQNLAEIKARKNKSNNLSIATQPNSIGFKIKLSKN